VIEINSKDYKPWEIETFFKNGFNTEKLSDSILNKHFYSVQYNREIMGMGAVSRDTQSKKSKLLYNNIYKSRLS